MLSWILINYIQIGHKVNTRYYSFKCTIEQYKCTIFPCTIHLRRTVANSESNIAGSPIQPVTKRQEECARGKGSAGEAGMTSSFWPNVKGAVCRGDAVAMSTNIYLIGCSPANALPLLLCGSDLGGTRKESSPLLSPFGQDSREGQGERVKDSLLRTNTLFPEIFRSIKKDFC